MADITLKQITPNAQIVRAAERTRRQLGTARPRERTRIVVEQGVEATEVSVPDAIADLMREAIAQIANGHAVRLVRDDEEMTTQQAADHLNVSRPYVTNLLTRGDIPHHRVGTHRRVYRSDVEQYRKTQSTRARKAMQDMVDQAEELGLYD
jgi:excisionase family DNA binding protein